MAATIHPTAIVHKGAQLGSDVRIGPYCVVGEHAKIGDKVHLHSHVVIDGRTTLGEKCEVFPFAVLGCPPQHTRYKGEPSTLDIGHSCVIREHVTMHPGTALDRMNTTVGNKGLFLAASHVAHDCVVGDNALFANNASLSGHALLGDHVYLGGFATVKQRCRIGDHVLLCAHSSAHGDVVPYAVAVGHTAKLAGINVIGLKRRGFDDALIATIRQLYSDLFETPGLFQERLAKAGKTYRDHPQAMKVIEFALKAGRDGVCQPGVQRR